MWWSAPDCFWNKNMDTADKINPYKGKLEQVCLFHFIWRFPSSVMTNNMRVEQGIADSPEQFLDLDECQNHNTRVCAEIDRRLRQKYGSPEIAVKALDEAINAVLLKSEIGISHSQNPSDYRKMFEIAAPIYREVSVLDGIDEENDLLL